MSSSSSIIRFNSAKEASVISCQHLRDEHSLVDDCILIDRLGIAAVKLAAELESFVFEILPNAFDFACSLSSSIARRMTFLRARECRDDYTPKAYFACLAAYNSGHLWGMWVDLTQDIDDIRADINDMLAHSPVAHISACEDYAIHDYDCFESLSLSEYESIERISKIANALDKHGQPFALYLDYFGEEDIEQALDQFEERYCGCFESPLDYAQYYYESNGMLESMEKAGLNSYYIDFKAIAHDWQCGGDFLFLEQSWRNVHVFYNH